MTLTESQGDISSGLLSGFIYSLRQSLTTQTETSVSPLVTPGQTEAGPSHCFASHNS